MYIAGHKTKISGSHPVSFCTCPECIIISLINSKVLLFSLSVRVSCRYLTKIWGKNWRLTQNEMNVWTSSCATGHFYLCEIGSSWNSGGEYSRRLGFDVVLLGSWFLIFEGSWSLLLEGSNIIFDCLALEDGSATVLWSMRNHLLNNTVSHPRRHNFQPFVVVL